MRNLLLVILFGCDPDTGDDSAPAGDDSAAVDDSAAAIDADEDGFSPPDDCDDTDATVHAGATEVIADDVDQDCDGNDLCYADNDVDGHGQETTIAEITCETRGASAVDDDCDDSDPLIHPGAKETCDDPTDYNCDNSVEYADADGDTWAACVDCDDNVASVHPEADEVAADGVDQDCDGGETCYADEDGDGFGSTATVLSSDADCADVGEADDADDCNDVDAGAHPGGVEIVGDGIDEDCDSGEVCFVDLDGDGYGSSDEVASIDVDCSDAGEADDHQDCDDADSTVFCLPFHVGNDVEFPDASKHGADYLLGSVLVVPTDMTVTHLALIGKAAVGNVKMALYTDSGGAPDALVVETASTPVVVGVEEMPVLTEAPLTAGTYWVMAVYDVTASVGLESVAATVMYRSLSFSSAIPATFGTGDIYGGQQFNYYIVGF